MSPPGELSEPLINGIDRLPNCIDRSRSVHVGYRFRIVDTILGNFGTNYSVDVGHLEASLHERAVEYKTYHMDG